MYASKTMARIRPNSSRILPELECFQLTVTIRFTRLPERPTTCNMSVTDCLSSANDLLAAHASLVSRVRTSQKYHRRQLAALPSPPQSLLKLDLLPSPPASPSLSPPSSPVLQPKQRVVRPDLPPVKKARVAKYQNYIPEEETIRNDYSQRYVDGGEWPQNWVLGADPARRFEE